MTKAMVRKVLLALPVEDRVDLMDDLNISIAKDQKELPVPNAHKRLLRQRIAEHRADPANTISHGELRKRMQQLKQRFSTQRRGKSA